LKYYAILYTEALKMHLLN